MNPAEAVLLIVDDNDDNRFALTRRLTREGYTNLVTASNGRKALELLQSRRFDLVLLDIVMPDMNGYQVLEHLKASAELRDVPVIMISAVEDLDSVIRCVELGAEDYLPKPFNATLLRARVGASLEKKRLRDEVRASLARLERELDAARLLQLGMLSTTFPAWSPERPVLVHALMEPAREVGGDLYDFFYAPPDMFCFAVGDVSGKGAQAAMFMARTRSLVRMAVELFRALTAKQGSPSGIAEAVNRELCQDNGEHMFVTLFLGFVDTRTGALTYINAGHPAPYVLRASGDIERVEGDPQTPLGVRSGAVYQDRTISLQPGDGIFACTDGIAEAMNPLEQLYTEARLESDLKTAHKAAPADMIRIVKQHIDDFTGTAPKADDVTMLALRWLPDA